MSLAHNTQLIYMACWLPFNMCSSPEKRKDRSEA